MRDRMWLAAVVAASASAIACSTSTTSTGATDGGSDVAAPGNAEYLTQCGVAAPCGGDLGGTWRFTGGCIQGDLTLGCPEAKPEFSGSVSGTIQFTGTTVLIDSSIHLRPVVTIPSSCPCPGTAFGGKGCLAGCLCYSNLSDSRGGSVPYTKSASTLTTVDLTGSSMATVDYAYCVAGSKLTLWRNDAAAYPSFTVLRLER